MKKNLKSLFLVLAATVLVVSCNKKEVAPPPPPAPMEVPTPPTPPVETASIVDPAIIQKVNDAIKDIPGAKAEDVDGVLTITGQVSSADARKLKMSVDALKLEKVDYKQTVK